VTEKPIVQPIDRIVPHETEHVMSVEQYKSVFRNHPGGVAVITADAGDGPVALTATSVASVSIDPPMLVFSVSELSSSTPTLLAADTVVVHLLNADQLELAKLGATSGIDRFADTSIWSRLETGEPYFTGATNWIRASVESRVNAGGSTIFVVLALDGQSPEDDGQSPPTSPALVYHHRAWHALGEHSKI
jgi:flavin reductase (DIM6/NTAB) family NADH-FMN oxidoreductase RutF